MLFVVSVFGIASALASQTATPNNVAVGELITVYYPSESQTPPDDPTIEASGTLVKGGAYKVSGPTKTGNNFVYTYRAKQPGTIYFKFGNEYRTNDVSITPKPHPMKAFMDILGFGKKK
ncbi:MAG: hypothetical protein GYA60_06400 [Candidatus Methanofastidiosa archaeon]|nr:hypothetical protein [Candidatus Methanofastidiosa archaeon]